MQKYIKPSTINGTLPAPSSKSQLQRMIAAAFLADGQTELITTSLCQDSVAALQIIEDMGAEITQNSSSIQIQSRKLFRKTHLNCHESGLCLRMFSPIISLYDQEFILSGSGSLKNRPITMLEAPLRSLGVRCQTRKGMIPVSLHGPLQPGKVSVDGSVSSQFLSGLLMALPLVNGNSEIRVHHLKSKPYIDLTLATLKDFGISIPPSDYTTFTVPGNQHYQPGIYPVEGDWSGAAFLLIAGAIAGRIKVTNLDIHSLQADRAILHVLELAGARITLMDGAITVYQSDLRGFDFNAEECPDLFPPLVVLACACRGLSRIQGVDRLIHKESNRAKALYTEFTRLGANIKIEDQTMLIQGRNLKGGYVDSYNDHRIAMAGAIAALNSQHGVTIRNCQCVAKSYPGFFKDLESIMELAVEPAPVGGKQ